MGVLSVWLEFWRFRWIQTPLGTENTPLTVWRKNPTLHGLDSIIPFGDSFQPDFTEFFKAGFGISNHRLNVE
jgi:hypothetical protein